MRARGMQRRVGVSEVETPLNFNKQREVFDVSAEFPDNEPSPEVHIGGRVMGFRRETIYKYEERIRVILDRALELQSDGGIRVQRGYFSYMVFHVCASGRQRVGTRVVAVDSNDNMCERFDKLFTMLDDLLKEIDKVGAGYEFLYEGDGAPAYVHFQYCMLTFPKPRGYKEWGDALPVENRPFFDIFTACDPNVDCVSQCAERIALKEHGLQNVRQCKTMDDLKERLEERLCILRFHPNVTRVAEVVDYTDLVLAKDSPCRDYNVIDTSKVYMVEYNGHVGLLENFKEQKRKKYYTIFRPLMKYSKCERITVCFDIECYFDPHKDQQHVPYLACCCLCYDDVPGNVAEFVSKDCVDSMIDYIVDICFKFKHREIEFSVKDSLHFLTCSLSRAAKSFLEESDRKTDFPYHEVLTPKDLQREMQEWLSVDIVVSANVEKERMLVTSEHIMRVDIDIGIEEGHKITYVPFDNEGNVGYSWKKSGLIFTDYIENMLYRLKLKYEQAGDQEKRHVIKIIMNSLWGKFAQKWMDTSYKIVNEEDSVSVGSPTAGENEAYKIWDTHHMLVKSHRNKIIADKPVQNGVFVLSWARHHMKKLWHECIKPGTQCLYSDTDSIFVPTMSIIENSPHIGDQMGQLELECKFDTFICVGKKQYMGSYLKNAKPVYKKRFKGVPQAYIRPDLFMHLLQHPDNKVQIDFLKFKREWGVVRGYIE
ncbi:hypothetical protein EV175_002784, partial [Coemansia sp. RSA 1933]